MNREKDIAVAASREPELDSAGFYLMGEAYEAALERVEALPDGWAPDDTKGVMVFYDVYAKEICERMRIPADWHCYVRLTVAQAIMRDREYRSAARVALTVNTSTPGNDLEYNGLAATRMEELERRTLKLELAVSALMEGKND